ncbi:unnamed protein product [Somion occarium]|uniref:P-loop containing nucleoside triphosphate hydrolase protein n=3 Tax=Somion occarium TaxID=3059160 RepID=A0ABP1CT95_9APHY
MRRCCFSTLRRPDLALPVSSNPIYYTRHYASHAACYAPLTPEPQSLPEFNSQEEKQSADPLDVACCNFDHLALTTRFDWRLRAPSRLRVDPRKTSPKHRPRRGPKRAQPPHENLQQGNRFYEELQAYQKHFLPLLAAEQAEDEEVLKERLSSWSEERLKQEGYCITGLSAFWLENNHFGRPVASFALGPGITLPEHRFENGTQVLLTRLDPLQEEPERGSIVGTTETQLRVCFQEMFDLDAGQWRLDVGRSSIVFDRMRTAISQLNHDPSRQESQTGTNDSDRQFILQGTHLRDILLRSFIRTQQDSDAQSEPDSQEDVPSASASVTLMDHRGVFKDDVRIQSWATRYSSPDPVVIEGDPILKDLNSTQIRAIAMMIGQRFTLVQGPPGTGKTKTIIEAVRLLKTHFEVFHPILLCTYTNVAVDNLVEGLLTTGLKPLRIGYGGKVKESLRETTLEAKIAAHRLSKDLERVNAQTEMVEKRRKNLLMRISELRSKKMASLAGRLINMETDLIWMDRQLAALKAKGYAIYQEMLKDIVSDADVVCTTCVTSASMALNVCDFPVVFVDEASMSTEPASLIPLMKGSQHVALIGDHKQLPPVITSPEAQAKGLGISLFERLAEEGIVPSIMLDIQYRMHPMISHFPSHEFYNFGLRNGTVDATGAVPAHLLPPTFSLPMFNADGENRPSVIFLDHQGIESMKDRSRVNINEAHLVCSVVEDLLLQNEQMRGHDIGIIAPYVAQISLLNRLLNIDAKYKKRFESVLGAHRAMQLPHIEVKTVDGFEGREKDVIIFSTVRNNSSGHIGFLADRRRLNVGLTRAKRGLFVLGNIDTLKAGRTGRGGSLDVASAFMKVGKGAEAWRRYAKFLDDEKLILKLQGEQLRKVLYGNYPL